MKPHLWIPTAAALIVGASLAFTSCKTITGERTTTFEGEPGVPGGTMVQTDEINATVTSIDSSRRKVTLVTRAGEKLVVTAGSGVVNFPQIRVGDQLKVTYTEEIVIRMAKPGEKIDESLAMTGDAAKVGKKPGVGISQTVQGSATVIDIDERRRKVKLRFADGTTKNYPVRDDIDLSKRKVGEVVVIHATDAFAVKMSKP